MDFFQTAGKNLIEAEKAAGVQLHVALSVVGTERLQDSGYFRAKLAQETLIKSAPIPYTLVRATQFMEFLRSIAQLATEGNTVRLSHAFIQPMAAEDVATAVVEAALAPPANGTIEVGGPEKFHLDKLVACVLEYDQDPRKVVTDPDARYSGVKLSENSLIPGKDAKLGSTQFDWWLRTSRRRRRSKAYVQKSRQWIWNRGLASCIDFYWQAHSYSALRVLLPLKKARR